MKTRYAYWMLQILIFTLFFTSGLLLGAYLNG